MLAHILSPVTPTADDMPAPDVITGRALVALGEKVKPCPECYNLTEETLCALCADPRRDRSLLCVVEDPECLEVEIAIAEHEAARVRPGQEVGLKPRALPGETVAARVARVAVGTETGGGPGTVTVYCRLADVPPGLRPGASGYGRVYTGQRPAGGIIAERVARLLRTEFWW